MPDSLKMQGNPKSMPQDVQDRRFRVPDPVPDPQWNSVKAQFRKCLLDFLLLTEADDIVAEETTG